MNHIMWDGAVDVEIPWRLLVVLYVLALGGATFALIALYDRVFVPTPPSRRAALDGELDGVCDQVSGAGIQPDTVRFWRGVSRFARLERLGAPATVLLHELSRIEADMAEVGARIAPLPAEGVQSARSHEAQYVEAEGITAVAS